MANDPMNVDLFWRLSDPYLEANRVNQRQLAISISAIADTSGHSVPLNLCLVLDNSNSMAGEPWHQVQLAAYQLVDTLKPSDRLSIILFNHQAQVLVSQQLVMHAQESIKQAIGNVRPGGGTAIDVGLKLGLEETLKPQGEAISQVFLLTDGENEHGDNSRLVKLAHSAADHGLTLSALGFGDRWNQDILETVADIGGGSLSYIHQPTEALLAFHHLLSRVQLVGLNNAYLHFNLLPGTRLAAFRPFAQVSPETVELPCQEPPLPPAVRLGDLMQGVPKVVLANLYVQGLFAESTHPIAQVQVQYDNPVHGQGNLRTEPTTILATTLPQYHPRPDTWVHQQVMALAKYRQTRLAEKKLAQGDRQGAATLLQTAAQTALQMGDTNAATVLQQNATRLQAGQELTEHDRKTTRLVSKTIFQS